MVSDCIGSVKWPQMFGILGLHLHHFQLQSLAISSSEDKVRFSVAVKLKLLLFS